MSTNMLVRVAQITLLLGVTTMWSMHSAVATPVSYELSGVASGMIGGAPFTSDSFTLIGSADTTGAFSGGPGVTVNPLASMVLNLSGLGAAWAVDPVYFFSNQSISTGGFIDIFSGDVFDFSGPALATYDGISPLAPVAVSTAFLAPYLTTLGTVNLTDATAMTFSVQQPMSVPEPSSLMLLALGLIGVVFLRPGGYSGVARFSKH